MPASVFDSFLGTPQMLGVFSAPAFVQAMLEAEAALARAEAAEGLVSAEAAAAIVAVCEVSRFDVPALVAAAPRAGSLAIPLVQRLKELVGPAFAAEVHRGATSQDIIDTAQVLCTRRAMALVDEDLGRLIEGLLRLAEAHGEAPMLARTLMQPAAATCLGCKLLDWLQPLVRTRRSLRETGAAALQLQLGGAVGTLAAMGGKGGAVARRMAALLGLPDPQGQWQVQRDDWARLAAGLGVLGGCLAKTAKDLSLMAQAEVAELSEPQEPGRGGSSAMPHKRNPVAAMLALAGTARTPQRVAALLGAMAQEHERGLGSWQAELAEFAGLLNDVHGALRPLAEAAPGLRVDEARMLANLQAFQGVDAMFGEGWIEAARQRVRQALPALAAQARAEAASPWKAWQPGKESHA